MPVLGYEELSARHRGYGWGPVSATALVGLRLFEAVLRIGDVDGTIDGTIDHPDPGLACAHWSIVTHSSMHRPEKGCFLASRCENPAIMADSRRVVCSLRARR